MNREGFWGILQSRRGSYLRAYLLWIAYFLVCAFLTDWWFAEPSNPPFWELSLNITDSMFASGGAWDSSFHFRGGGDVGRDNSDKKERGESDGIDIQEPAEQVDYEGA